MTDDVFLSAILAEPGDDLPRLAYADWLEEKGDPRGEFIHVQCRLARLGESDPHHPRLKEREQELLDSYEADWLGELAPLAKRSTFRRGFLDEVALEPGAFLAYTLPRCPPTVRRVLVGLEGYWAEQRLVEYLPESVAYENLCFPIGERGRALFLAMEQPEDTDLIQKLNFILNRDIAPVPATAAQIVDAIVRHYGATETETVDSILVDFSFVGPPGPLEPTYAGEPGGSFTNLLLRRAIRSGATRIRLEPSASGVEVFFRVLGHPVQFDTIPWQLAPLVVAHLRERCGLPSEGGEIQHGRFGTRVNNLLSRFDVHIVPTSGGPRVVLDVDTSYDPAAPPS
jgi:type IV pilus assembly protein PilB